MDCSEGKATKKNIKQPLFIYDIDIYLVLHPDNSRFSMGFRSEFRIPHLRRLDVALCAEAKRRCVEMVEEAEEGEEEVHDRSLVAESCVLMFFFDQIMDFLVNSWGFLGDFLRMSWGFIEIYWGFTLDLMKIYWGSGISVGISWY